MEHGSLCSRLVPAVVPLPVTPKVNHALALLSYAKVIELEVVSRILPEKLTVRATVTSLSSSTTKISTSLELCLSVVHWITTTSSRPVWSHFSTRPSRMFETHPWMQFCNFFNEYFFDISIISKNFLSCLCAFSLTKALLWSNSYIQGLSSASEPPNLEWFGTNDFGTNSVLQEESRVRIKDIVKEWCR